MPPGQQTPPPVTVHKGGKGFTVIVTVCGVPGQPFAEGVTVIVATTGVDPEFMAVNGAMVLPVPAAASPIDGLVLVHEKVVPGTVDVKIIAAVFDWLQITWLADTVTTGTGNTDTVAVA